jgi:hypothetical protein
MIRDLLIPAIKQSFPDLPFSFSQSSNPVAKLQPPFGEIGTLDIYDDGGEATVDITEVTHGHFSPHDTSLSEQQRDQRIVEDVIRFLRALFADQVLLFRTPGRGNRGVGGWYRLDESPEPPVLNPKYEYFLWSGPYGERKVA